MTRTFSTRAIRCFDGSAPSSINTAMIRDRCISITAKPMSEREKYLRKMRIGTTYLSVLQARCRPFIEDDCFWCMAIELSPAYFAQLKHELEANGHEVILRDDFFW